MEQEQAKFQVQNVRAYLLHPDRFPLIKTAQLAKRLGMEKYQIWWFFRKDREKITNMELVEKAEMLVEQAKLLGYDPDRAY
jgi:hypothetical protein